MLLLIVNLSEFQQFLQITLWIAIPAAIVAILVTTFLHYRRKKRVEEVVDWENAEERANARVDNRDVEEANEPYRGYLWMKDKYERLLEATDGRYFDMKDRLGIEMAKVSELNITIIDLNVTIADLTARLEANRKMLLNIHNEMGVASALVAGAASAELAPAPAAEPTLTPVTPTESAGTETPEVNEITRAS